MIKFNYMFFDTKSADIFEEFVSVMNIEFIREKDSITDTIVITTTIENHKILSKKALELY